MRLPILTGLVSIATFSCKSEILLIICFDPISINSVFATFCVCQLKTELHINTYTNICTYTYTNIQIYINIHTTKGI